MSFETDSANLPSPEDDALKAEIEEAEEFIKSGPGIVSPMEPIQQLQALVLALVSLLIKKEIIEPEEISQEHVRTLQQLDQLAARRQQAYEIAHHKVSKQRAEESRKHLTKLAQVLGLPPEAVDSL